MKKILRFRAIQLRERGWSYNVIKKRLGVSKSSLSLWLRDLPYEPNATVRRRTREGPLAAAKRRMKKRLESTLLIKKHAAKELGTITIRDLFVLGIGIYMGEGMKSFDSVRVVNADPNIICLAVRWFKEICGLGTQHLHMVIHLYPDVIIVDALDYWSKMSGIPVCQFGKTQIDVRKKTAKKQGKLPYGTAHLSIRSCGEKRFGVVLHRRIMGWIDAVYKQIK